jgi:hypothetical protein
MENAQKLHQEFIRLGSMRHKLKNRMLAILPEIYKSGIYKKYSGSIVEYAGKFGDIAKTTVIKRLRLEKNLEDKPFLKAVIEKVGVHKVALVAKIATSETDKIFAEKVENMSRVAVQSLSKELRAGENGYGQLCHAVPRTAKIELDEESTFLLMKLKAKLGKHLSDKEFLKLVLKDRVGQEFPEKTEKKNNKKIPSQSATRLKMALCRENSARENVTGDTFGSENRHPQSEVKVAKTETEKTPKITRYIRACKKRQTIARTSGKCSYPGCNSPFQILHHVDRFSESRSHDSVIPLCKIHHEFAHNNLIKNENLNTKQWELAVASQGAELGAGLVDGSVAGSVAGQDAGSSAGPVTGPVTGPMAGSVATQPSQISQAEILYRKYRQKARQKAFA